MKRKVSEIEENNSEEILGVVFEEELLDINNSERNILGIAIDIGTTGISYSLLDLSNGEIVKKSSSLNPQTQYGGDVLTRIAYCMEEPLGSIKLQELIIQEINSTIKSLVADSNNIDDIRFIGHWCLKLNKCNNEITICEIK